MTDKDKRLMDEVDEIFLEHPDDYHERLEDLGFEFVDDIVASMEDGLELLEEELAQPENQRQRRLVAFFEGDGQVTEDIFMLFSREKASDNPNYPLFRKYFRRGNQRLKELILYGLERYPGRIDLLDDLAFFNQFHPVYPLLVKYYKRACLFQSDMETFSDLVSDFFHITSRHQHMEYYALMELFHEGSTQKKIMEFLVTNSRKGHTLH